MSGAVVSRVGVCLALASGLGCSGKPEQPPGRSAGAEGQGRAGGGAPEVPHTAVRDEGRQSEPVLTFVDGAGGQKEERWISAEQALAAGQTLVDFSDEWTPYLFEEQRDEHGKLLPNRYRRVFIGLANDQLDGDGEPLEPGSKNYLELYGIFPSFSVLRERFLKDEAQSCVDPESTEALQAVKAVAFPSVAQQRRDAIRQPKIGKELEQARLATRVETLEELAEKKPALAAKVKDFQRWTSAGKAVAAAEKRLICEGFLQAPETVSPKARNKHQMGMQDALFSNALRHFQQKHMIYEGHALRPRTLAALARRSRMITKRCFGLCANGSSPLPTSWRTAPPTPRAARPRIRTRPANACRSGTSRRSTRPPRPSSSGWKSPRARWRSSSVMMQRRSSASAPL
jgi:hypothetical protein